VFSHGWPLSADDWDAQLLFFLHHGYRVIAHDRRGHGRSTQTADGHDMDHYSDDLAALTAHLDLKNAIIVRSWEICALTSSRSAWRVLREGKPIALFDMGRVRTLRADSCRFGEGR
jgi:alpha-beta hydrolase superfamily lysophospholipase